MSHSILLIFLVIIYTVLVSANADDFVVLDTDFDVQDNVSTFETSTTDSYELEPQQRAACTSPTCRIGNYNYKPCKDGKCGKSPFSECLGGSSCRDCAVYKDDCSSKPCCAVVSDRFTSICFGGKCRFCNKYDEGCGYVKSTGGRSNCCKTAGKTDVQCRYFNGADKAVCRSDPCSSGEDKRLASPKGFTGRVERCDAVLPGEPQNHDFECVGGDKKGDCVRCLGFKASCDNEDSSSGLKCCSTYLKCGAGKLCELKSCRPTGFQCTSPESCCSKKCDVSGAVRACG